MAERDSEDETAEPGRRRLAALVDSLANGSLDEVARLFAAARSRAPLVLWAPKPEEIADDLVRSFAEECLSMASGGNCILTECFDVRRLQNFNEWLMVVDVVDDGEDFVYAYYGSAIAGSYGQDMTGKRASSFDGHISLYFRALYGATARRKEPVLSAQEPPECVFVHTWRRLIFPVIDGIGAVTRFVALNVAENALRAGLEVVPTPCLVADGAKTVLYANPAARAMHGNRVWTMGQKIAEAIGCDLPIPGTPERMLATGEITSAVVRVPGLNGELRAYTASVGAAQLGNRTVYVITLL